MKNKLVLAIFMVLSVLLTITLKTLADDPPVQPPPPRATPPFMVSPVSPLARPGKTIYLPLIVRGE